jgi:hypothetical protein
MKKTEIIKHLIVTKEFTSNTTAKEMLQNAINFINKEQKK